MKIQPIDVKQNAYKGKFKAPYSLKVTNLQKNEYINEIKALCIADVFKKFEENFRTTMETFIYMIKH